jgi:hypothetical protein
MTQSISILMPSGAMSIPKTHKPTLTTKYNAVGMSFLVTDKGPIFTPDTILAHAAAYAKIMKTWPDFEAWIVLFEDEREISREHIQTDTAEAKDGVSEG